MSKPTIQDILAALDGSLTVSQGQVRVTAPGRFQKKVGALARFSALGTPQEQGLARYLTRVAAHSFGIYPASIHSLYEARGRGEAPHGFTVPAFNLRALSFDSARVLFRAAKQVKAAAFICELARSEMAFTDQRAAEYATSVLAAAIAEGYKGPVFIQGDHFQVSAKRYRQDPDAEVEGLRALIREAVPAGFYNIDVDTSTLVDLGQPTILGQQVLNAQLSALFTTYIRSVQPQGVTIAVGGEIGEVGGHNSTEAELRAYLDGYRDEMNNTGAASICKVSIQTGTTHGGEMLADGSIAPANVDFDALQALSRVAREEYGLGGAVQHGASTLPDEAFPRFPQAEAVEIHLATQIMSLFYDRLPDELKADIYHHLDEAYAAERQPDMTDEQFYHKTRKYAVGLYKREAWSLPESLKDELGAAWEARFLAYFKHLKVEDTRSLVERHVRPVEARPELAYYLGEPAASLGDYFDTAD